MFRFHDLHTPASADRYDLIVLGSGPAGQKCAIDAAKRGKKVAVVDKGANTGGVCVHTGTIPSKTFREARRARRLDEQEAARKRQGPVSQDPLIEPLLKERPVQRKCCIVQ